ncbi:phosphoenolpyruvate--protein phosphotransferase [Nonomuraea sediminis]|uniref:phosphoenolpyruvate--protein phosphotransferase n=1 Tax=Nonomuraea sediminis TaxID=2835864 RepID=UPI001BDDBD2E|nr:phosphoenolpyruvate--protein phosphotransferase [Nonomuraea sediminis]
MKGVGVSPGIGHGPAYVLATVVPEPPEGLTYDGDADDEKARAQAALQQVAGALESRGHQAGGEARSILQAQALMAADPGLAVGVKSLIDRGVAAPRAIYEAFEKYREMLIGAGGYLGGRAADLDDVRDRAIALLTGQPLPGVPSEAAEPYVLVARDLAPADTAVLSKDVVAAFVTEEGGPTSHTAILARALGVPAVVACPGATTIPPGASVLVDGTSGEVRLAPSEDDVAEAEHAASIRQAAVDATRGPGRTRDGFPVALLANVGRPADLDPALANGAEGVGLYRTELLFLDRAEAPSLEEQEAAYRAVLESFPGGKVVVRTLDAGADKPLRFLPASGGEPNPALGERGLRLFRAFPDVMASQLAALAAAVVGTEAELQVMAPMVATAEEARWFVNACRTAGLDSAGVMIEIPAAALRAESLVTVADFVSIGTNDLAQYTFAADRQLGALTALQDPWQPVLLDLVAGTATAASDNGKPCGVCGEAAADPELACVLVGLGVTSLSMNAHALPAVRAALAASTLGDCQLAAQAARAATTAAHARAAARAYLPGLADLGL